MIIKFRRHDLKLPFKIYIFKCQVSLLIRELHIKITVRYYFLPGRIAVVKKKREDINAAIVENVEVP